ncbi:hypothetical protein pah_c224o002 [Parachlamydia acanthamoebae str. Hall's coccus]|nr:hypothetical protein pah_c224o002 [Parachlamydia acanthamoebae str. Hall's coccus]
MSEKSPNKYQRTLKLKKFQNFFEDLQFEYSPSRNVYEVFRN